MAVARTRVDVSIRLVGNGAAGVGVMGGAVGILVTARVGGTLVTEGNIVATIRWVGTTSAGCWACCDVRLPQATMVMVNSMNTTCAGSETKYGFPLARG